jgi:hypothetical protein
MTDDDLAFMRWAGRRSKWLLRFATRRATWKPLRILAAESAGLVIRLERKWWRATVHRRIRPETEGA